KSGGLTPVNNDYNSQTALTLAPAGQALGSAGLFTSAQLQELRAAAPIIATAPAGHVGLDNFVADDIRLSYPVHLGKLWRRFGEQITPYAPLGIYYGANKANPDPPAGFITSPLRGVLDGSAGAVNGATA